MKSTIFTRLGNSRLAALATILSLVAITTVMVGGVSESASADPDPTLPQLSQSSFSTPGTTGLTIAITNTAAAPAQPGLSFVLALPAGMTAASGSTTCLGASAGGASITVNGQTVHFGATNAGKLSAGTASCSVTVDVTMPPAPTMSTVSASDYSSLTNLNAPTSDASVTGTDQPIWDCSTFGYLFQSPSGGGHTVQAIDIVSGKSVGSVVSTPDNLNAVGYNPTDDYMYGWDMDTNSIARIGSDGSEVNLGVPSGVNSTFTYFSGDVDSNGDYYMLVPTSGPGSGKWYEIDLNPGSSTYFQVLNSGNLPVDKGYPDDFAFVDGTAYGVVGPFNSDGAAHLDEFDFASNDVVDLGEGANSGGIGSATGHEEGDYGADYAVNGTLYSSNDDSGHIYQVNVSNEAGKLFSDGPSSPNNDGARCATAGLPQITVTKDVTSRANPSDQFTVALDQMGSSGTTVLGSASTSGTDTTATTGAIPLPTSSTYTYTVTDAVNGSTDTLANYTASISCVDAATGAVKTGGTAGAWTVSLPAGLSTAGTPIPDITCTVTNSANAVAAPAITVVKSADVSSVTAANQPVNYSFLVTNTGNVALSAVTINEVSFSGSPALNVSCPATSLAPGESVTCTATYSATQADIDAGVITNTATATGTPTSGPAVTSLPSTAVVSATQSPAITVLKSASPSDSAHFTFGQLVTYSFLATDTGNTTLTGVTINEGTFTGSGSMSAVSCPSTTLTPGGSMTCTATYTITQADVDNGSIVNTATATGTPPTGIPVTSPPSTVTLTSSPSAAISVVKSASPTSITTAGQLVSYSFLVTNTGNVTLNDATVNETAFSGATSLSVSCPAAAASLAPGESVTCTATYSATQADIDAGVITNTATATGTPTSGPAVTSLPSTAVVSATQSPAITVLKTASPTSITAAGQVVDYSFLVTNTGDVTLDAATVNETAFSGTGTVPVAVCPAAAASLAPGDSVTCSASYTSTQADIDAGQITNTATASGTPPAGPVVTSDPSSATVTATQSPAMTVVKTASVSTISTVGQVVTYSFLVTDTGNTTLTDVTVNEGTFTGSGSVSAVSCPSTDLAPGDSMTCTATYTITQADLDHDSVANTATATGTPPSGPPVDSPPSTVTTPVTPAPAISVVKSASPTSISSAGQVVSYSFLVTNTGNVTLDNASVAETAFSGTGATPAAICPAAAALLDPGDSVTCSASYTATQADIDAGLITNTATASATPPSGPEVTSAPSSATVTATQSPAITVLKTASPSDPADFTVGHLVTYSFLATDTGNTSLTAVTINEGVFTGSGHMSAVTCPASAASLAPGDSVTCTATYTITQADVNSGSIVNTATATGIPPSGTPVVSPPSTVTLSNIPAPAIAVLKTASVESVTAAGQLITYSFDVTNTGNVTLTNATVNETAFSGSGTMSAVSCPSMALDPGDSITCTASYTSTQADIDAGVITNTATASGTPPAGPVVTSAPSTATVTASQSPAITVVKTASPSDVADFTVGQLVTYSFLATDTGNTTLTDVTINEGVFTGSGHMSAVDCPADATSLAPGDSVTCTARYTITQADVDQGSIVNTATATGTPPSGTPVVSPPSTVTLTSTPTPAIAVVKTADVKIVTDPGQVITYSFLITNTGNVTLKNATVIEGSFNGIGQLSPVTCPAAVASLAPGDSVTCTATYLVQVADLTNEPLSNTATATGTPPDALTPPVSLPSTAVVQTWTGPLVFTGGHLAGAPHPAMWSWLLIAVGALLAALATAIGIASRRRRSQHD